MRLFVALELPAEVRDALWGWSGALDAGRWRRVPADNLHVTLAFLGSRPQRDVGVVSDVLAAAAPGGAPLLRCSRVVALPPRRPRVVAVGLQEDAEGGRLAAVQASVAAGLSAAGVYEPEPRPFLAHVTVGRARRPSRGAGRAAPRPPADMAPPECSFSARAVTLFESRPGPGGSTYVPLASAPL